MRSSRRNQGRRLHIPTRNEQTRNLAVFHLVAPCSLFPKRRPLPTGVRGCPEIGSVLPSGHHKLASRFCRTLSPPLSHKAVSTYVVPGMPPTFGSLIAPSMGGTQVHRIGGPIWQPLSR